MKRIAIIGFSCLFPQAATPDAFWENLIAERDLTSDASPAQMGIDPILLYAPTPGQHDKYYYRRGGYIHDFAFDPAIYGLPTSSIDGQDLSYQWALYVTGEALRTSGYLGDAATLNRTGIILGNLSFPTRTSHRLFNNYYREAVDSAIETLLGPLGPGLTDSSQESTIRPENVRISGYPAAFVAQAFQLRQAKFCLDAACASSLYAIHLACHYLSTGKSDMMLAGAVSCADPHDINMGFSIFRAYPESGQVSHPLDRASRGLTAGEGAGMVVLKRYEDAVRDGDKIYASILGIGLSNDGQGKHLLIPNASGQMAAFERAYASAAIPPASVSYVECHATGTPTGDLTEIQTTSTFFDMHGATPSIGSVKSNLGHLLTAAGMAGLIKVLLSMENQIIPATIQVSEPVSDKLPIITSATAWEQPLKRAGVSAFGFGGTNAHLVLENTPLPSATPMVDETACPATVPLAIIGMEACFGEFHTLADLKTAIRTDQPSTVLDSFDLDFLHFKIPPTPDDQPIAQQLLMLKVADAALCDAGIKRGTNTAVLIAMESDPELHRVHARVDLPRYLQQKLSHLALTPDELDELTTICQDSILPWPGVNKYLSYIGNIIASRISAQWDLSGPSFTVSAEASSVMYALEVAQMLLATEQAEAVLIGAIDLAGGSEYAYKRSLLRRVNAAVELPTLIGEGAGAILLKRSDRTVAGLDRVYATIEGLSIVNHNEPSALALSEACRGALANAGIMPHEVEYIECVNDSEMPLNNVEEQGLASVYGDSQPHLGSVQDRIGNTFTASGIAGLIHAVLKMHHGNAAGSRSGPTKHENNDPYPWRRVFAVNGLDRDGRHGHLILSADVSTLSAVARNSSTPETVTEAKSFIRRVTPRSPSIREAILTERNLAQFAHLRRQTDPIGVLSQSLQPDHLAFLQKQQATLRELGQTLLQEMQALEGGLLLPSKSDVDETCIWNEDDLIEFAEGSIAAVFGPEYAVIDTYRRRVRLPLLPYLLVSRITHLDAERGAYRPSSIVTEYDVPRSAWYTIDGQIPTAVAVESGQCDLLLISYLGIDFENKGERVYRLLNCTLTFLNVLPMEDTTLRYHITINSFARNGDNLLFFFSYDCFVGDKLILKMTEGCAGFFSDKELQAGKGILPAGRGKSRQDHSPSYFSPLLFCQRDTFDKAALLSLTEGDLVGCFGPLYESRGLNPSLRLPPAALLMLDRVVSVDPHGGTWGLGAITVEKDLTPEDWYFPCHFKDDQVLAGSLMSEGCVQLLQFFMLYLGMQVRTEDARFQPIFGVPQVVQCRGQVTPTYGSLIYQMEITDLGLAPNPYARANVNIVFDRKTVVRFESLSVQLLEKNPSVLTVRKPALFDERHIEAFAVGSMVDAFGPDYAKYDHRHVPRTPNGELKLISRITEIIATRHDPHALASLVSEYDVPMAPWFYYGTGFPITPYSILMELGLQPCGALCAYLDTMAHVDEDDYHFRNLNGQGTLYDFPDLRGKTVVNHVRLLSTSIMKNIILQSFAFQLTVDEQIFYEGTASFGYFNTQALSNQVGLDRGAEVLPWYAQQNLLLESATDSYRSIAHGQIDFLDNVWITEGYLYAQKTVNPEDWFYRCHFYQDPVMPGSLGLEAIMQALQTYAVHYGYTAQFTAPQFEQVIGHEIIWKYRGQIIPSSGQMSLEVHLTGLEVTPEAVTLVGDASLWRDDLRIYEVKHIAVRVQEAR